MFCPRYLTYILNGILFPRMFAHSLSTDSRQDPKPTGINNAFFVDYDAACYALEQWQSEWDEFPESKLRVIFPHLKDCTFCPRTNRKEESVTSRLHCIGHSYITHSFLLMGEKPPVCIACDERFNYRTSFTFLFWFYWDKREPFYSSVLFQDIGKYLEYLKETNIF